MIDKETCKKMVAVEEIKCGQILILFQDKVNNIC